MLRDITRRVRDAILALSMQGGSQGRSEFGTVSCGRWEIGCRGGLFQGEDCAWVETRNCYSVGHGGAVSSRVGFRSLIGNQLFTS